MNWWKKALLFSIGWLISTIAGGIILTDVILKDSMIPQRDMMISSGLGV